MIGLLKRKSEKKVKSKKQIKVTNFHLVNEFIWFEIQKFCDLKTFLTFFYINKSSNASMKNKEEYFQKEMIKIFGIDFKLFKDMYFTYHINFGALPFLIQFTY